jgi:hypothetical protein
MYAFEVGPAALGERLLVPLYRARHVVADLSAAGRLPVASLGDLTDVASGTYFDTYAASGVPYLRVDNVREFVCNLNTDDLVFVDPTAHRLTARVRLQDQDVLLARTGTLGKAALARGPLTGAVLSQHLAIWRRS